MDSWRWHNRTRSIKSIKRDIIHTLHAIPPKKVARRLLLPPHTGHGHSSVAWECAFLWGMIWPIIEISIELYFILWKGVCFNNFCREQNVCFYYNYKTYLTNIHSKRMVQKDWLHQVVKTSDTCIIVNLAEPQSLHHHIAVSICRFLVWTNLYECSNLSINLLLTLVVILQNWLPRRLMSAWHVAGILHAAEGWEEHECGYTITDINKAWQASLQHGFQPLGIPAHGPRNWVRFISIHIKHGHICDTMQRTIQYPLGWLT